MCKDKAVFGEQAPDAVDAGGTLFFVTFAQAVHAQQRLLLRRLDGHKAHAGARGCFADGGCVVGVILAALALHAVRPHEVAGNEPRIKAHLLQSPGPVVGAAAGLHRDQAAGRQL